jgi:hypothetical protein
MRGRLIVWCFTVAALSIATSPADANDYRPGQSPKPGGNTDGGQPGVVVAKDGTGATIASRPYRPKGGRPSARLTCVYYAISGPGGLGVGIDRNAGPQTPKVGLAYWLTCSDEDGNERQPIMVLWDPATPFGPMFAGADSAAEARNAIPLPSPAISTSPPLGRAQLVGIATWLWIDDPWVPLTASATLGGVTATVTATPVEVEWQAGDGTSAFVCAGPGVAFAPDHPDQVPTCSHTYTDRSTVDHPDGTFALTATVTYEVAWTATNGEAGDLEPLTRTSTVPIVVHEAQAVIE